METLSNFPVKIGTARRKMNSSLKHIVLQLEDLTQQDVSIGLGLDRLCLSQFMEVGQAAFKWVCSLRLAY